MKKIQLSNVQAPEKTRVRTSQAAYRVYFGHGKLHLFKSRKAALAFIADSNRQLNLFLHELNHHFAEGFSIYRHCWFYFLDKSSGVNRIQTEKRIKVGFEIIENSMNKAIHNTSGENGSVFAFSFLSGACDQLLNIAMAMKDILQIRNELVMKYRVETMAGQIQALKTKIDQYGISQARH